MLSVFADDSSDETQQRTVAVAEIIASDEEWSRLDRTWLERTGGIPFHAPDWDLIEKRTRVIAISIIKIFIKILRRCLPLVIRGGGAQRWIWLATENFSSLTKRLATTRRSLQL